jgi:hypothetical protein
MSEENIKFFFTENEINNENELKNINYDVNVDSHVINYKINYNVKDLLLICSYYGISQLIKTNKCNKEEMILALVTFENDIKNQEIVLRRKNMWFYINELKNDKFMKKYILL